ncbi:MAG: hypothetical protein WED00_05010 [Aquisalimonadaceae bacterium]
MVDKKTARLLISDMRAEFEQLEQIVDWQELVRGHLLKTIKPRR